MLYEVLDRAAPEDANHMALTMPLPGTQRVLFRAEGGGVAPALWRVAAMEGVEGAVELSREEACVTPDAGKETRLPGFAGEETCVLLAAPGASLLEASEAPAAPAAPVPAPAGEEALRGEEVPAPAPRPERAGAPREREKPRLNARAQAMALQTGLNPAAAAVCRRSSTTSGGASRIDQLGHPVPAEATGMPVQDPVERAVEALRAAWRVEETRPKLAEAVGALEGLGSAMQESAERREDEARARRLNEIEAQRLRLLNEVRRAGSPPRRRPRAPAGGCAPRKRPQTRGKRAQAGRAQGRHRRLRRARPGRARGVGRGRERICRGGKAPRRPRRGSERPALSARAAVSVPTDAALPSAGELISDVRAYLARAGAPLSHDQAVELFTALALSPVTVLCGSAFAPKGELARALAGALGLRGRFLPITHPQRQEGAVRAILEDTLNPAPALLLVEDCNVPARAASMDALLWQLIRGCAPDHPARLLLTARDEGDPLSTELLDSAFVLRLEPESATRPGTRSGKRRWSRSWPYRARRCATCSAPIPRP